MPREATDLDRQPWASPRIPGRNSSERSAFIRILHGWASQRGRAARGGMERGGVRTAVARAMHSGVAFLYTASATSPVASTSPALPRLAQRTVPKPWTYAEP